MVKRSDTKWEPGDPLRWLTFLAEHMNSLHTSDLAWWELHRSVKILRSRYGRALVIGICASLVAAFVYTLKNLAIPAFNHGVWFTLVRSLAYGAAASVATLSNPNQNLPSIGVNERHGLRTFMRGVGVGLASGLSYGLVTGVAYWIERGFSAAIAGAVIFTLVAGVAYGLANGIVVLLRPAQPTRAEIHITSRRHLLALVRSLVKGAALGSAGGAILGALGLVYTLVVRSWVGLAAGFGIGIGVGLIFGLVVGFIEWARTPAESDEMASPGRSLQADRTVTSLLSALLGVTLATTFPLVIGLLGSLLGGPTDFEALFGFALMGLLIGSLTGALTGTWTLYTLARLRLAAGGRLPWRLMTFLEDAQRLDVLRQAGAVFQFRHTRIRYHLTKSKADSSK